MNREGKVNLKGRPLTEQSRWSLAMLLGLLLFSLSSCSFSSTVQPDKEMSGAMEKRPPASTDSAAQTNKSSVEIVWAVEDDAEEEIIAYHLHHGFSKEALTSSKRLAVNQLERLNDPVLGEVYRTYLEDIPNEEDLFISLQAENQYGLSPHSPVMLVPRREAGS